MNFKTITGLLLMTPMFVVGLAWAICQFDNPTFTSTQIFNEIGWWPFAALIPFIGGAVLFSAGRDDYEDPE